MLRLKHRAEKNIDSYKMFTQQQQRWMLQLQPMTCRSCGIEFADSWEFCNHQVKVQHLSEEFPEWRCLNDLNEEKRYEQEVDITPGPPWRWNGPDRGECGGPPHPAE